LRTLPVFRGNDVAEEAIELLLVLLLESRDLGSCRREQRLVPQGCIFAFELGEALSKVRGGGALALQVPDFLVRSRFGRRDALRHLPDKGRVIIRGAAGVPADAQLSEELGSQRGPEIGVVVVPGVELDVDDALDEELARLLIARRTASQLVDRRLDQVHVGGLAGAPIAKETDGKGRPGFAQAYHLGERSRLARQTKSVFRQRPDRIVSHIVRVGAPFGLGQAQIGVWLDGIELRVPESRSVR
jgi:hypothetical protein